MPTEYAVKAETHEGNVMVLRRGFMSEDAAEDHPVTAKHWKRVWVEAIALIEVEQPAPVLPPKPWDWIAAGAPSNNGNFHAYLVDATGKKIGAIWGGRAKALIADHILKCVNGG
jgi:hypothetical protein